MSRFKIPAIGGKDSARRERVEHSFNLALAVIAELTPDPQEAMEALARASAWGINEVGENADTFIDFMLQNLDVLKKAKEVTTQQQ